MIKLDKLVEISRTFASRYRRELSQDVLITFTGVKTAYVQRLKQVNNLRV